MLGPILMAALAAAISAQGNEQLNQLETGRLVQPAQRVEFGNGNDADISAFKFRFADPELATVIDNESVLQLQATKASNAFLATLAVPGEAQFLTVLKPCGILLHHVHLRANEFYSVIFGTMDAGISQENGAAQNIAFEVQPGEVFVVPQGLLHYNHNRQCTPNAFFQSFSSADPGAINVVGALASLAASGDAGEQAARVSITGGISPTGAFALDQECLKECGFPESGAPGDGLGDLPEYFRALFGIASDEYMGSLRTLIETTPDGAPVNGSVIWIPLLLMLSMLMLM